MKNKIPLKFSKYQFCNKVNPKNIKKDLTVKNFLFGFKTMVPELYSAVVVLVFYARWLVLQVFNLTSGSFQILHLTSVDVSVMKVPDSLLSIS